MKKILCSLFIVSLFAVSFAEEFDMLQYRELVNAANKARKEGNSAEYVKLSKQARTYLETTDLATDAASQNVQLAVLAFGTYVSKNSDLPNSQIFYPSF